MAVLEKIRVKLGVVISVIIALALLSFIIDPGTLESALNSMSSKYDVGQIAGKRISYTDFQSDVDRYTTISELLGANRSEDTQKQARNAARSFSTNTCLSRTPRKPASPSVWTR